jgi:NhaP-type Na+/H+ or K+/H+ antiporter
MNVEVTLLVLSSLVIFSYGFDLFARRTKIPSVILLLATGVGLAYAGRALGISLQGLQQVLPLLGTVGLILIVLEGALELRLRPEKRAVIRRATAAALAILLATAFGAAALLYFLFEAGPWRLCLLNAIPFAIISSAIAIPSASTLPEEQKEFVVYESSLSDIFGIVMFNFVLTTTSYNVGAFFKLGGSLVFIICLAFLFCLGLLFLLKSIAHKVKFLLIIAMLMWAYAVGKYFHLPTLLIVLGFGLVLNNAQAIPFGWFKRHFMYPNFNHDLEQMHSFSGDSAFLVRTFFFLLFGIGIHLEELQAFNLWLMGGAILIAIYVIRAAYLKFRQRELTITRLFMAPRGLISILLFLSIPQAERLGNLNQNVLILVILGTAVMMTVGLLKARKTAAGDSGAVS